MRVLILSLLAAVLCACASDPKPPPPPVEEPPAIPKIGIVGLVQPTRTREINKENWREALAGIVRNSEKDDNANVASTVYEVTVFYEGGQQEVVTLEQNPQLRPGQRVRVTGKKIEVLPPR